MAGSAMAQSNLPACQGDRAVWTDCFGSHTYASGNKYVGEYKNGKFNGRGTETFAIGNKYVGEYKDGNRNGQFTVTYPSGYKYVGEYKDDKKNGRGITFLINGKVEKTGIWKDNILVQSKFIDVATFTRIPNLSNIVSNLSDCTGWVMVFSDGKKTCSASYSAAIKGHEGLGDALTSKLDGEFYAFASNTIIAGGGGFGGSARFSGIGRSQNTLAEASRIAVNECESARSRLVPFVSGNTTYKRTDECILLISAKPTGPLILSLSEAEFHKTWPSDQLIYERHVEMYGEEYAKSQLSEPPPQVQATVKPELSDLEIALAEAEQNMRKQAELEAQLAAVQQAQAKPTAQMAPQGKRVALVIGNAKYKFSPLNNPVNDATDMAASLRSVGFDVIEVKDATLKQMRAATRQFADKLEVSDVGLVYYSGHGIEVKGKNYLIPVNADIRREYEVVDQAFDASNLLRMMEGLQSGAKKRVNILIVDACRNNDLPKSWRSTNNGLARMDAPAGSFISFATAPGQVASDGQGRNSPYTKHLLNALKQPNVPIEQVFKQVRRNVMDETGGEQVPWENSSLIGDFYFTVAR